MWILFALQNAAVSCSVKRLPRPVNISLLASQPGLAGSAQSTLKRRWSSSVYKERSFWTVVTFRFRPAICPSIVTGPCWPGLFTGMPPCRTHMENCAALSETTAASGSTGKTCVLHMDRIQPAEPPGPNLLSSSLLKPNMPQVVSSSWLPRRTCTQLGSSRFSARISSRISRAWPPLSTMSPSKRYWFLLDGGPYLKKIHRTSSSCPCVSPTITSRPLPGTDILMTFGASAQKPCARPRTWTTASGENTLRP
mmetsp:Transcript_67729/g.218833  ORF Transcript_67729/g.218833 Transcript_67729/m.218833 type:complete len:252 (+) Transcript_67729:1523-2278(+)